MKTDDVKPDAQTASPAPVCSAPRTDAQLSQEAPAWWPKQCWVPAEFAAGLERELNEIKTEMGDLLVNIAQILDVVKTEWSDEWSEWDQEQRNHITRFLIKHFPPNEPSSPTGGGE